MKNKSQEKNIIFRSGFVSILGPPNSGKSTLMNRLVGYDLSAVTHKPQTTRGEVRGIMNEEDNQVIFLDTPGIIKARYGLHEAMIKAVNKAFKDSDLALFLIDAQKGKDENALRFFKGPEPGHPSLILAINKIDLVKKSSLLPLIDSMKDIAELKGVFLISAINGNGVAELKEAIIRHLPLQEPYYPRDQLSEQPERFFVREIIRKVFFESYGEEVPYSSGVMVEEFKERDGRKDFIRVVIYVEKATQKGIIIGKKGAAIKVLGKKAREDIQRFLEREVYLELWVKVRRGWRKSLRDLKELGYL